MGEQGTRSKEVDEYISNLSPETQKALEELRLCIWHAAPNVSELMNYNIPAFALVKDGKRDQQIMIAGFSKHVGFYPTPSVIEAFNSFHISRYGTHIKLSINQQVENRYNNCGYAFPRTTWEREGSTWKIKNILMFSIQTG